MTQNIPVKSRYIGGMYIIITAFIAILYLSIYAFGGLAGIPAAGKTTLSVVMLGVVVLMIITTLSFYNTKYVISDGLLTSWSPFFRIKIRLKDIKSVEKIPVPIHFRVGASLYSGKFYAPSIGWIGSIITNLSDAILIKTKSGDKFMITPSNPSRFIRLLKKK